MLVIPFVHCMSFYTRYSRPENYCPRLALGSVLDNNSRTPKTVPFGYEESSGLWSDLVVSPHPSPDAGCVPMCVVVAAAVVVVACVPAIYYVTFPCCVIHPVPRACFLYPKASSPPLPPRRLLHADMICREGIPGGGRCTSSII